MNRYLSFLLNQFELHTEQYKKDLERKRKYEEKGYIVELQYENEQCHIQLVCMEELGLCIFSYLDLSQNISGSTKSEVEKRIDALTKDRQAFERSIYGADNTSTPPGGRVSNVDTGGYETRRI